MLAQDVPFFLGQLPKRRQSVLELAVGTARAAIPIAQAGHRVVGVDYDAQMLAIAKRKRDSVAIAEKNLKLVRQDALRLDLHEKFDWVCIFFNTLVNFTTLDQQDRLLQGVRKHLKRARAILARYFQSGSASARARKPQSSIRFCFMFHISIAPCRASPRFSPDPVNQRQHVIFQYRWFDRAGHERREKVEFDLTFIFPRELRLLVERNGMKIESIYGNYDGSALTNHSPRMIARCRLK